MVVRLLLAIGTAILLAVSPAWAQGTRTANPPPALDAEGPLVPDSTTVMVTLNGGPLFRVMGVGAVSARDRAEALSASILKIAKSPQHDLGQLQVIADDSTQTAMMLCGFQYLGAVWAPEAEAAGTTPVELAEQRLEIIRNAVSRYRDDFSNRSIIRGALIAAAAIALMLLLLWALDWGLDRLEIILQRWLEGRTLFRFLRGEGLASFIQSVTRIGHFLGAAWLILVTLNLVLGLFPWTYAISNQVFEMALRPLRAFGRALVNEIPSLFFLVFIIIATGFILRGIHFFFKEVERRRIRIRGFYSDWAEPTYNIARLVVIAFAFVVAFPYIPGSNSDAFKGMSLFIGLLVSLGSGSAMANIISGVILIYMRPYEIGDRVQIGNATGDVMDRNLLTTRLRTTKNERVTIPNTAILAGQIYNFSTKSRKRELILHTTVSIGYDAPWKQVHELLINAAKATEDISEDPEPYVLQLKLHDFYVEYEINAYTDEPRRINLTYSRLHENIQDQFNSAGVEILSPHYRSFRRAADQVLDETREAEIRKEERRRRNEPEEELPPDAVKTDQAPDGEQTVEEIIEDEWEEEMGEVPVEEETDPPNKDGPTDADGPTEKS